MISLFVVKNEYDIHCQEHIVTVALCMYALGLHIWIATHVLCEYKRVVKMSLLLFQFLSLVHPHAKDTEGRLIVQQISVDHNTQNERELQRLAECGLDPHTLRKNKRLGTQQNTRSIGDYSIKGGYTDVDVIRLVQRVCVCVCVSGRLHVTA